MQICGYADMHLIRIFENMLNPFMDHLFSIGMVPNYKQYLKNWLEKKMWIFLSVCQKQSLIPISIKQICGGSIFMGLFSISGEAVPDHTPIHPVFTPCNLTFWCFRSWILKFWDLSGGIFHWWDESNNQNKPQTIKA